MSSIYGDYIIKINWLWTRYALKQLISAPGNKLVEVTQLLVPIEVTGLYTTHMQAQN